MTARIGIVGIGWWATVNHIPAIAQNPHAEVVAICDLDADRLATVGEKFSIPARYTDLDAMLANENLDGVIVSTPHTAHAAPAIAALEAGCHVLIEKPMATTAADGRAIAAAARHTGKSVIVPCGLNFAPFTEKAAQLVRDGRIGTVRHVICQMGSALEDLFAGEPMIETENDLFRPPASTWADPQKAGGYGWGQLSHGLAWLFYVADMRLESVFAFEGKSKAGVDMYDAVAARADNGATLAISGAGTVPKHKGLQYDVRIFGSEGVLFLDIERPRLELHRNDGGIETVALAEGEAAYDGMLPVHAFAALCAGEPVINTADAENGARVTEALDAMYRSMKSGTPVRIGG